jgi:hypothetical protein
MTTTPSAIRAFPCVGVGPAAAGRPPRERWLAARLQCPANQLATSIIGREERQPAPSTASRRSLETAGLAGSGTKEARNGCARFSRTAATQRCVIRTLSRKSARSGSHVASRSLAPAPRRARDSSSVSPGFRVRCNWPVSQQRGASFSRALCEVCRAVARRRRARRCGSLGEVWGIVSPIFGRKVS